MHKCKKCHQRRKKSEMFVNWRSRTPTKVCMKCVLDKRSSTRLTNAPVRAKLKEASKEANSGIDAMLAEFAQNLKEQYKKLGRKVIDVMLEGSEIVIRYTQIGEHRLAV